MMTTTLAFGMPGGSEMIVIFFVVLLLFGAKKIPELARGIGKGMGEFKKAKRDFEDELKAGEEQGKDDWDKHASDDNSDKHASDGDSDSDSDTHSAA